MFSVQLSKVDGHYAQNNSEWAVNDPEDYVWLLSRRGWHHSVRNFVPPRPSSGRLTISSVPRVTVPGCRL